MNDQQATLAVELSESDNVFAQLQRIVQGRMPALDGLRAFAVLSVLWHNAVWAGGSWQTTGIFTHGLKGLVNAGWVGVQLFFVLSGFLITGILLDEKGAPQQIRNFYARRVLRIFPLYYCTLFLLFVIFPAAGWFSSALGVAGANQIWYWTFLSNWSIPIIGGPGSLSHFWSLAVEEQFYLVWPFVVVALSCRNLVRLCLVLIASAALTRIAMISYGFEFAHWRAYEFTFARWDALACGALLAVAVRSCELSEVLQRFAKPVCAACLLYVFVVIADFHGYDAVEAGFGALNQTIIAILFSAVIYFAVVPAETLSIGQKLLWSAPLRNIGKYSYAIYVFHYPVALVLLGWWGQHMHSVDAAHPTPAMLVRVLLVFAISYVLALCSWHLLEQPFLRLKRFFIASKIA